MGAEQVVLIGDHKQLGPIYKCEILKSESMFNRLMEGDFPNKTMLKKQYRMHSFLLEVPNTLFYDQMIESGYKNSFENLFIHKDKPLLFVDC